MKTAHKSLASITAGILLFTLGSCGVATNNSRLTSTSKETVPSVSQPSSSDLQTTPAPSSTTSPAVTSSPAPEKDQNAATVTIYQADSDCNLVPHKIALSAGNSLENIVGKVLTQETRDDFKLAGYRVNFNADNGIATIDLRLHPDSKRQFVSLSSCEQYALFGSLRQTLTANSQWQVKTVEFTNQGKQIVL